MRRKLYSVLREAFCNTKTKKDHQLKEILNLKRFFGGLVISGPDVTV